MMFVLSSDETVIAEVEEKARRTVERIENAWWREPLRAGYPEGSGVRTGSAGTQ